MRNPGDASEQYASGGFSVSQLAKIAALNAGGNLVIHKLVEALKKAPNEKEAARIRAQIDRELAALGGGQ